jgi:hypothetical protein
MQAFFLHGSPLAMEKFSHSPCPKYNALPYCQAPIVQPTQDDKIYTKEVIIFAKRGRTMSSIYRCETCRVISDEKEGLCQPEKLASRSEFCPSAPNQANPICHRMDQRLEYQCHSCGRLTDKADLVCSPILFAGADEGITGVWRRTPFRPRKEWPNNERRL